jgi:hypothetical protein
MDGIGVFQNLAQCQINFSYKYPNIVSENANANDPDENPSVATAAFERNKWRWRRQRRSLILNQTPATLIHGQGPTQSIRIHHKISSDIQTKYECVERFVESDLQNRIILSTSPF